MSSIEHIITPRDRDLGGFSVRRLLPAAQHRMVGPFIFLDHMGPADMPAGKGMDVRPHPHIGLATVTYLFQGHIYHRDSLGSEQVIEPGAINWMTAGRGIVHSERSPSDWRKKGDSLNGLQCWVALPFESEETDPSFVHHPSRTLPEFQVQDVRFKLLLGTAFNQVSPVKVHSDMFYLEAHMPANSKIDWKDDGREMAFYVLQGSIVVDGQQILKGSMAVIKPGQSVILQTSENSHLMFLGGKNIGPRFIYWNFVSSSQERLEEVKKLWSQGPSLQNPRFKSIPGDDAEYIPLPTT